VAVGIPSKIEVEAFVKIKMEDLRRYKLDLQALKDKEASEKSSDNCQKKGGIENKGRIEPDKKSKFDDKSTVDNNTASMISVLS
jgi:hypothetical protein